MYIMLNIIVIIVAIFMFLFWGLMTVALTVNEECNTGKAIALKLIMYVAAVIAAFYIGLNIN
jgi:hypothetical protein